jgi:hypothetical protein
MLPTAKAAATDTYHPEPVSTIKTSRVSRSFLKSVLTQDTSGIPSPKLKQTADSEDGKSSSSSYRANGLRIHAEKAQPSSKRQKNSKTAFSLFVDELKLCISTVQPHKPHGKTSTISLVTFSVHMALVSKQIQIFTRGIFHPHMRKETGWLDSLLVLGPLTVQVQALSV